MATQGAHGQDDTALRRSKENKGKHPALGRGTHECPRAHVVLTPRPCGVPLRLTTEPFKGLNTTRWYVLLSGRTQYLHSTRSAQLQHAPTHIVDDNHATQKCRQCQQK